MGERERVDDQKLSTNGGFWTLPPRLLRTSLLFVPEPRLYIYNGKIFEYGLSG
ncbi:unnamed protein product [Penicillium salamii]|uniref:Uncharacterized protein n=1 Tax=Penicillium salamii TaxID=1612424 RepID=A0A9W4I8F9_9EURO|nr:unnamed protein product [Penicillium salamii]CAG8234728.1 unnamed protein product [Penicillium salamii]CAG8255836.1 unnamed protein product [Penicillium salamii]CAG8260722.1 unnamed protein product [Penicillium salamii]CAG8348214.1 unnamed protein product [Penicillium salamii]